MRKRNWFLLTIGVSFLFLDGLTKYLVHSHLPIYGLNLYPYGGIGVFQNLFGIECSIVHTVNTGAAWSFFSGYQIPLLILRVGLIGGMFYYLIYKDRSIPLVLIISGALGNVIDYLFYGHVVDMIHFVFWGYHYPIFNIADSAIFIGVSWLLLRSKKLSFQCDASI